MAGVGSTRARIQVLTDRERHPGLGVPTRLAVRTDAGETRVDVPRSGRVEVRLPEGESDSVAVEVLATDRGRPVGVLTGLTEVQLDDIAVRETVVAPAERGGLAEEILLSGGLPGSDGCVHPEGDVVCFGEGAHDPEGGAVLSRRFTASGGQTYEATGTVVASPWAPTVPGLRAPGVSVRTSSSRSSALGARPEALVDANEHTAWSPAPDDASPEISLTLDEPADIDAVVLHARRGWFARYRPFVRVRLDGREQLVRASGDGRLDVRGRDVRTVSVSVLPLPGRQRSAAASLELEELELAGHDLARPADRVTENCGAGPSLEVDGTVVPTRLDGPALGPVGPGGPVLERVQRCGARPRRRPRGRRPGRRGAAPGHRASLPRGLLGPDGSTTPVTVTAESATHLTGTVAEGAQRLLALTLNQNPGWEATLGGTRLAPIVVDGFRQGFVLPEGAAGTLDVVFAPDQAYRAALVVGLVLAALLVVALVIPERARSVTPVAGDPHAGTAVGRRRRGRGGLRIGGRRALGGADGGVRRGWPRAAAHRLLGDEWRSPSSSWSPAPGCWSP